MAAYYNENDPKAAAWLRALINEGLIANGYVDERSIKEVKPNDLKGYKQVHLFAGIGGWSYALRLAGVSDETPCWTGSCPCQPFSSAGRRKGEADERHLWPEMLRLLTECRPATVFGEQVASRDGRGWLARVRADLEALGYAVGGADLCAASVGAPHIRQRLYWAGVTNSARRQPRRKTTAPVGQGSSALADGGGVSDAKVQRWQRRGLANQAGQETVEGARLLRPPQHHPSDRLPIASASRLPDTEQPQLSGSRRQVEWGATTEHGRAFDGLHNSERRRRRARTSKVQTGRDSVGWSEFDVIACRDGKLRRIEPGLIPVVDGVPGRVAQLRGLGNAIVPQVAARFIRASIEAIEEQS